MCIAVTGKYKNGLFIGVLFTNTVTGIIQEIRAKRILDKLAVINQTTAVVLRDGKETEIANEEVVLGDVLLLKKGDQVCVDCEILTVTSLFADESMLTGENVPVGKKQGEMLFSGSYITEGSCYAVAKIVGEECYGAVITARAKKRKKIHSQILDDVEKIVRIMSFVIIPSGILLFLSQMFLSEINWKSNLILTVASMIGMIPNGLILLITAAFSLGVYRIFKKGALAQEPAVIEAISTIDVMCFDKTGTVTQKGTNILKQEIPDFMDYLQKNGIETKIISGDSAEYVVLVAKQAGIANYENVCDLSALDMEETLKASTQYNVFCRATPEQKMWIVRGIKENGKKCAMVGDGVNDVMALKEADCGISPLSGTDAAKGVAGIILTESDFSVLKYCFSEGRRAVNNLEKTACLYFNKTVYSLLLTLFTIFFSAVSNTKYPFEPIQMTAINALAVGIPSILITLQNNTSKPSKNFIKYVLSNALPFGISVAFGVICLTVSAKFGIISVKELSFASYALAGFMAFALLYHCGKPHTKLSMLILFLLAGLFALTFLLKEFFSLGIINATAAFATMAAVCVSIIVIITLKKSIKF